MGGRNMKYKMAPMTKNHAFMWAQLKHWVHEAGIHTIPDDNIKQTYARVERWMKELEEEEK
jgi:hypothetical protein